MQCCRIIIRANIVKVRQNFIALPENVWAGTAWYHHTRDIRILEVINVAKKGQRSVLRDMKNFEGYENYFNPTD